jgi:RNA polymerase sigma-70 factor (ECF subfamily)
MADDKYLALLPRLQEGDRQAFSELVSALHANMRSIARSMLSNGEAEEAVQDAWISVYKNIAKFEGRSSLKTWITRIVINESRMRLRRHGREINLDMSSEEQDALTDRFRHNGHWQQAPVAWDFATPDQILEERDLRRCMEKNLTKMPPQQRLVMELRDMQGLSFDDICNMLDISASNARVLLHRARAQLFTVVEHYQETGEC